jgi:2-dehydropantoate 2-reductase
MRHAVLGAGGIGGLLGAALAGDGQEVLLLMRPRTLAAYPGRLRLESALLGELEVEVPAASRLERPVEVLWVAVKATQLEEAMPSAPPEAAGAAAVVPLLNGVDHVARLRQAYGEAVIPGAIRVESERMDPDRVVQPSPFAAIDLAPPPHLRGLAEAVARELRSAGLSCNVRDSEADVLWGKLALLAPLALATSSVQRPLGDVRSDEPLRELMLACAREACAVAMAEGATLDPAAYEQALLHAPASMRSSMQKDLAAGRQLELDAIAGPIIRGGRHHALPTPATEELARRVAAAQAL